MQSAFFFFCNVFFLSGPFFTVGGYLVNCDQMCFCFCVEFNHHYSTIIIIIIIIEKEKTTKIPTKKQEVPFVFLLRLVRWRGRKTIDLLCKPLKTLFLEKQKGMILAEVRDAAFGQS